MTVHADDADAVRSVHEAERRAMVAGDADALAALLADHFTLTHMTGFVQSKQGWIDAVRSSAMSYHSIRDEEVTVRRVAGVMELTARSTTEATIWGAHGTWRLQLRTTYIRERGVVVAEKTVATTW